MSILHKNFCNMHIARHNMHIAIESILPQTYVLPWLAEGQPSNLGTIPPWYHRDTTTLHHYLTWKEAYYYGWQDSGYFYEKGVVWRKIRKILSRGSDDVNQNRIIIRVQVVCLPSANQSSGSLVPGSRTVTSMIMHENLNEISSLGFGSVICSFSLRVLPKGCELIILISGPSEHKFKQWKQSSASPPWSWHSPASQLMNSVEVRL